MSSLPEVKKSFAVEGSSKKLYISNQELISHGCKNCIWRLHNQCKHGIVSESDFYEFEEGKITYSGYCLEYVNFILSLAEPNDSISAVWEKFSLYVGRMQSLEDYKKYIELKNQIEIMEKDGDSYVKRAKFEMKKEMLRLWWERLNDTVRKGYAMIADRESRSKDVKSSMAGIMNAEVINFNMGKQIEEKKDERRDS
jgi:hypothetical protein